jgi:hypothetical protein
MLSPSPTLRWSLVHASISVALLTLAGTIVVLWKQVTPLPLMADDVLSLIQACRLTSLEYGTLYHLGYCGIRRLVPDPLLAFDVKQSTVLFAMVVVMFRFARVTNAGYVASAGITLWFTMTLTSVNGTSLVALLVFMLGYIVAVSHPRWLWHIHCTTIGCAFLVRSEYLLVAVGSVVLLWFVRPREEESIDRRTALTSALTVVVLLAFLLVASRAYSSRNPNYIPREWLAFGQHYAANAKEVRGEMGDSGMEWTYFVGRSFPTSNSVMGAAMENPAAFSWHVTWNISKYFVPALQSLFVPRGSSTLQFSLLCCIIPVVAYGLLHYKVSRYSDVMLLSIVFVPFYSSLVVRPKSDYLLPFVPITIVFIASGLKRIREHRWLITQHYPIILLILTTVAAFYQINSLLDTNNTRTGSVSSIISELRVIGNTQPIRLYSSWYADRICGLAQTPSCWASNFVNHQRPGTQLEESPGQLLRRARPVFVLVGPDWSGFNLVRNDAELQKLLVAPDRHGCTQLLHTNDGYRLLHCAAQ